MPKWIGTPRADRFIRDNPSVKTWLDKIPGMSSRNVYGQTLQQICEGIRFSPENLLDIRTQDKVDAYKTLGLRKPRVSRNHDTNGYAIIDKITKFLTSGTMQVKRGGKVELVKVKVAKLSVTRRVYMYAIVKSFFKHNRCELPEEKLNITEQSRTKEQVYLTLDDARSIIGALKQPYHTLCEVALYAGMGVGEIGLLNELWPRIRKQLEADVDVVRIDISRRKGNREGYFTFIPSRLLKPFTKSKTTPFKNTHGKMISPSDMEQAFKFARKRAGITKRVYPHMIRDLFRTASQFKAGMDGAVANFLIGHSLRKEMGYLQPEQEPEKIQEEWKKWQTFLDTGVASEQEKKVADMKHEIELLQAAVKLLQEGKES